MIFQSYALWPHMTVAENIVYGLTLRKMDRDTIAKKLAAILATTKLEPLAQRYPGELSGGQQQRVALARALIVEPETLLLDEPLSNLDANLREEMRFEIRRLHDEYRYTTVYVTHDQSEAMTTADLIAVMNGGRIDQLGTPEDIYARPQSEFVARFIGASNVLKGTARDENHMSFAGATLRVTGAKLTAGQSAAVAIRQHDIQLSTQAPASGENTIKATVTRQVYLGASRDYVVETADGNSLRVVTPTETAVDKGTGSLADLAARSLSGAEPIAMRSRAMKRKLSRRDVLKGSAALGLTAISASVKAAAPEPTAITPALRRGREEGRQGRSLLLDGPAGR